MTRLLVGLAVATVVLTVYALVDAALFDRNRIRGLPRFAWILVVLFVPIIGPLLWIVVGRGRRSSGSPSAAHHGTGRRPRVPRPSRPRRRAGAAHPPARGGARRARQRCGIRVRRRPADDRATPDAKPKQPATPTAPAMPPAHPVRGMPEASDSRSADGADGHARLAASRTAAAARPATTRGPCWASSCASACAMSSLSPGSRSQALALAAAELERLGAVQLHVRIDERGAGFIALGLAVESGRPALVITHLRHRASAQPASRGARGQPRRVPLIVLTADRPDELRGIRANQTTVQPGLFGAAVRLSADVPAPDGRSRRARGCAGARPARPGRRRSAPPRTRPGAPEPRAPRAALRTVPDAALALFAAERAEPPLPTTPPSAGDAPPRRRRAAAVADRDSSRTRHDRRRRRRRRPRGRGVRPCRPLAAAGRGVERRTLRPEPRRRGPRAARPRMAPDFGGTRRARRRVRPPDAQPRGSGSHRPRRCRDHRRRRRRPRVVQPTRSAERAVRVTTTAGAPTAEERRWVGRWVHASRGIRDQAASAGAAAATDSATESAAAQKPLRSGVALGGHVENFAAQREYVAAEFRAIRAPLTRSSLVDAVWAATLAARPPRVRRVPPDPRGRRVCPARRSPCTPTGASPASTARSPPPSASRWPAAGRRGNGARAARRPRPPPRRRLALLRRRASRARGCR